MDAYFDKYPAESGRRTFSTAGLLFLLQIAAFWGVWHSIGSRFVASNEALWGVLPFCFIAFFSYLAKPADDSKIGSVPLICAAIFLVAYASSYAFAPPMARAVLAFISLTFVLSSWRFQTAFHVGILLLFLL